MPHADSAFLPDSIQTKSEFWDHVHLQLSALLDGQRYWVSNLSNAASLIYSSLLGFPKYFGESDKAVNWAGFYIRGDLFPISRISSQSLLPADQLLLGPFCGKPACQFIPVASGKERGVCAAAYVKRETIVVPDVEEYPGHIACDGETKSEIVCPLILEHGGRVTILGVLDLDCLALNGFGEEDRVGLEKVAKLVVDSSDW
ncbi:GAF domain-like protein [Coprinellus micaceus]|uniref:GAF domain-like protein n=1 Tax=Coprinellus micaceus TaxID=71717 RepID=A0A4Y7T898_COPMI|nr:GAF domain-like protein [Coprinellus micaceus]